MKEAAVVRLNPAPVTAAELMANGAAPVFATVSDKSLVWPAVTFPNASDVADKLSLGAEAVFP